ncbi:unnamed protein product [Gongylonema pulchrum]|uniref:CULLIN_2 domain-containing protein n=2 Tax=Gongylonema pulchrum TaxID=637853 RepID=A0A183DPY2_9BILA|nr:unnamed protein product [Gongylonema pulchrum]
MSIVTPPVSSEMGSSQPPQCPNFYSLRPKQVDFDATWRNVENSIKRIMRLQPLERRVWDYNFYDIYSLCVAIPEPLSERLYMKTNECLDEHVAELCQEVNAANDSELLSKYCQLWNVYYKGALCIHNLFGYLNKQYVRIKRCSEIDGAYSPCSQFSRRQDLKEIGLLSMEIWRKKLIEPMEHRLIDNVLKAIAADREGTNHIPVDIVRGVIISFVQLSMEIWRKKLIEPMEHRLIDNVLKAIAADREGTNHIPVDIVRGVIISFVQVNDVDNLREKSDRLPTLAEQNFETYRKMFESKFLEATEEYYAVLSNKLLSELSCSSFMEAVISRIDDENERSRRFLPKVSHDKVTKLCRDVMVNAHKEHLYAVCHECIEAGRPLTGGLSVVVQEFEAFVKRTGLAAVTSIQGDNIPQQFVENVLKVYKKFSSMVSNVFYDDGDFTSALDKALQTIVNYREEPRAIPKASERLSRYTDMLLRKSGKGLSDSELDAKLAEAIIIFRYIEDKDVFQRQACGFEFTSKLSRMFTDVGLSHELTEHFVAVSCIISTTGSRYCFFLIQEHLNQGERSLGNL